MTATIHPYKGYINTNFHVHVLGSSQKYIVYEKDDVECTPIISGIVNPNEPHLLNMPKPGDFIVSFENGDHIDIHVEDGCKFGGSRHKKSFIFDKCPWCFIVMHDRTYFYNRNTKREYVESISPDKISEVSSRYVLLENNDQQECTLYDLDEEKPVLWISNVLTYNEKVLVWRECDQTKKELCVISLDSLTLQIDRFEYDDYTIDESNKSILFYSGTNVYRISLTNYNGTFYCQSPKVGTIISLASPNVVISYEERYNSNYIYIYDIDSGDLLKKVEIDGHLAEINGKEIINLNDRRSSLNAIDYNELKVPELILSAIYQRISVYSCDWDVFYIVTTITLTKNGINTVNRKEKSMLFSINTKDEVTIKSHMYNFIVYRNAICLYNNQECYTRCKDYSGSGKKEGGSVYRHGDSVYLYKENVLYKLSSNGYWDNPRNINLDFSDFSKFGVVKNHETNTMETLSGRGLGKAICTLYMDTHYIWTNDYAIFSNCRILSTKAFVDAFPQAFSETLYWGIEVKNCGAFVCHLIDGKFTKEPIMTELYDTADYKDVLLSEDGNYMLYRDAEKVVIQNIEDGKAQSFDNLSYVKHVNGIRPTFNSPTSLQPIMVNPVTGQHISANQMTEYKFVSPKGEYYADTRVLDYIEHFYIEGNKLIPYDDYLKLIEKYSYPHMEKEGSQAWEIVTLARKKLILDNIEFLRKEYPNKYPKNLDENFWNSKLNDNIPHDVNCFLGDLIGTRGIAVIRNTVDDTEYVKIDLGSPLEYINYVSFSYDSKYVAIAGYRARGGGLLVIYDLINGETVVRQETRMAVWNVSFAANNAFAAYTSTPNTFFAKSEEDYSYEGFSDRLIQGYNFLTFSPDGNYFALSRQGYVSKYGRYGIVRDNWGHQSSSIVEVRQVSAYNEKIDEYSDLGDSGISGAYLRESVASVCFSNNNQRLMMVGNDGVVIIRNIKLKEYASK